MMTSWPMHGIILTQIAPSPGPPTQCISHQYFDEEAGAGLITA